MLGVTTDPLKNWDLIVELDMEQMMKCGFLEYAQPLFQEEIRLSFRGLSRTSLEARYQHDTIISYDALLIITMGLFDEGENEKDEEVVYFDGNGLHLLAQFNDFTAPTSLVNQLREYSAMYETGAPIQEVADVFRALLDTKDLVSTKKPLVDTTVNRFGVSPDKLLAEGSPITTFAPLFAEDNREVGGLYIDLLSNLEDLAEKPHLVKINPNIGESLTKLLSLKGAPVKALASLFELCMNGETASASRVYNTIDMVLNSHCLSMQYNLHSTPTN